MEPSAMERMRTGRGRVASVAETTPVVPKVSGLWCGARTIGKQFASPARSPFQRSLYREFVGAGKCPGR